MSSLAVTFSRLLAAALLPVLAWQGGAVRRSVPILPEADGPRSGAAGTGTTGASATGTDAEGTSIGTTGEPLRLIMIGESTAVGVGVLLQADGLAPQLASAIAALAVRRVDWRVVGRTGITAREAKRDLIPQAASEHYDLAVVVLGVNDTLKVRSTHAWERALTSIVESLSAAEPGAQVIIAGVPPVGTFTALPNPLRAVLGLNSERLDAAARSVADRYARFTHVSSPALDAPAAFAIDGFHPGAAGYAQWAQHLASAWAMNSSSAT